MPDPRAYYNEHDPFAAQWLRELIAANLIAPGEVDERSISDVTPADLTGFSQHHFFAGIGGWSAALRLAGWPDDRPVWTGSCPCQPFSAAGAGAGFDDERHLWPDWHWLVDVCRPGVVFGEQVESAIRHGWLDLVSADLEGLGYAVGPVVLPAAGVGAFHQRHRLWWVAKHDGAGRGRAARQPDGGGRAAALWQGQAESGRRGGLGDVGHSDHPRPQGRRERRDGAGERVAGASGLGGGAVAEPGRERRGRGQRPAPRGLDDGAPAGRPQGDDGPVGLGEAGAGFWSSAVWIPCRDGKHRPVEPGIFPLVDGLRSGRVAVGRAVQQARAALSPEEAAHEFSRVGALRGAGNAIVPQVAAEVIGAYMDLRGLRRSP